MEDAPQPISDERLKNLEEAFNCITRTPVSRSDNAVYFLERAGEIELRDKLIPAVFKEFVDYLVVLSENLMKDYSTEKAEVFLDGLLHSPSNFYSSCRSKGLHTHSHFAILARLLAVGREIRGNMADTLKASRLYEDLGDSEKSEELLEKGQNMDPDVFENTPEFDVEIKSAVQNFINDIGHDPIMLVDPKKVIEEVTNDIRQKIGN